MRSLVCIEHDDWEGTIERIESLGGKSAQGKPSPSPSPYNFNIIILDWVVDKMHSKFAFEGMCWAKSHIPKIIWQAGNSNSNLVESVHADVNREGIACTLVGGLKKGYAFDTLKMQTLSVRSLSRVWK